MIKHWKRNKEQRTLSAWNQTWCSKVPWQHQQQDWGQGKRSRVSYLHGSVLCSHLLLRWTAYHLLKLSSPGNWGLSRKNSLLSSSLFQVSVCPECREPYPEKPRRHRFAERAAEELAALESERADILDSNLKNISVDGNMDISSDPNSKPANEPERISSIPEAAKENLPEIKNSSKTKKQTQTKRKQQKK